MALPGSVSSWQKKEAEQANQPRKKAQTGERERAFFPHHQGFRYIVTKTPSEEFTSREIPEGWKIQEITTKTRTVPGAGPSREARDPPGSHSTI